MGDFGKLLEEQIPRLRRYAHALTRNASVADDLIQECLMRAFTKQHLWQPGTDLRAWLFTILHNQHVNYVRRSSKEGVSVGVEEVAPFLPIEPNAVPSLELRDLRSALAKLPIEQRDERRKRRLGCASSPNEPPRRVKANRRISGKSQGL